MGSKLDMENAFDCVHHSFLFQVLEKFGFCLELIKWIDLCISVAWITPLVNGRPTYFFQGRCGLYQGFPLSPLLFIIMANPLSHKLEHEREIGNLSDLQMVLGVKNINHSQFVDDNLFLGGASQIIASRFK
jgi:hypothetical protein